MVVLASDGYPNLKGTLEESECELSDVIENDPMCFLLHRSTKGVRDDRNTSYDDRAFCRLLV